jgi:hypothetical protein
MLLGLVCALALAIARDQRSAPLAALFAAGVAHQAGVLSEGAPPALAFDATTLGAVAMALLCAAGFLALHALHQTSIERDRAEDLHWDTMEALRSANELTSRAPGDGDERLLELLRLAVVRFELRVGLLLDADGGVCAWHALPGAPRDLEATRAALAGAVEVARASERPVARDELLGEAPALGLESFFGAAVRLDGELLGVIALAGPKPAQAPTATDKDLLCMLAQRAGAELRRASTPARAAAAPRPAAARTADPTQRLTARLRDRFDGDIEVAVDPILFRARTARIPIERLVESLLLGARHLSPEGALRVESQPLPSPDGESDWVTLSVHVEGEALDGQALNRAFDAPAAGGLPLETLRRRLRSEGGDVSVAVESGCGATLTAFLPPRRRATRRRSRAPAQSSRYVV